MRTATPFDFQGKTALITGASSGLGAQFARVLSNRGCRVLLAARRLEKLEDLAKDLNNATPVCLDVGDSKAVQQAFETLEASGERIDICINSAGIAAYTPIFELDVEKNFEHQIQTNLLGVWYVTKAVTQHMKRHEIPGSIIQIASVNGADVPATGASAYCASKAAVIHLTKTLVGELSPHRIRINCISPGWFKTPMNGPNVDKIIPHIPLGHLADPKAMDELVLYLASNEASSYVTGSCFTIDGGISWGGKTWP